MAARSPGRPPAPWAVLVLGSGSGLGPDCPSGDAGVPSRWSTRVSNPAGGAAGGSNSKLPAGRHQLTHVLAADPAPLEVRDRARALAPGERAECQLGGHVMHVRACHVVVLGTT